MKRIVTPQSLKWLINKKARLLGEIQNIETYVPNLLQDMEVRLFEAQRSTDQLKIDYEKYLVLQKSLSELKEKLNAINIALDMHDIKINKDLIRPIKPTTKVVTSIAPWGGLTRGIYECLRITERPTGTKEIVTFLLSKYSLNNSSLSFVDITKAVGKRTNILAKQGKIIRCPTEHASAEGFWDLPPADV